MSTLRRAFLPLALLATSVAGTAHAQKLTLTLTGGSPIAFPAPTETDYDNTFVPATAALGFTLDLLGGGGGGVNRHGILSIRAASSVMGGTKPIGDMQWRRSDLATWNSLTTADVQVESRAMVRNTTNDPWSNSILFRVNLNWANDGPATYTPTIILTATLTTP